MTEDERVAVEVLRIQERAMQAHRAQHAPIDTQSALTCLECGNPIPADRRAALPGVTLCIECKRAEEQQERNYRGL